MSGETVWIGLDLGQETSSICAVDDLGASLHEDTCRTTVSEIEKSLSSFAQPTMGLIAVEAGTETHIVRQLRARGYPVAIFDARKASRFLAIRRNKSDSSDAKGLADLARLGRHTVSQVYLKSPECQQLRGRLITRQRLVRLRGVTCKFVRSRLAFQGRPVGRGQSFANLEKQVRDRLSKLVREEGLDLRPDLLPLMDILGSLDEQIKRFDRELEKIAKAHSVTRLLMEVPGVGPICALSFYTAVDDPTRFKRNCDVAAYLGLIPRRYQSGLASKTMGITKNGSKLTRTHLVTAAIVFLMHGPDCALREWALALRDRVGPRRSNIALARKLAIILLAMWKNGTHFEHYPRGQPALSVS